MIRWKFAGEIMLFIVYLGTGMMVGWTLALGESALEKTVSTLSMSAALILLWGIHRWRNIYIWKIQTTVDGAITGAIIGADRRAATYIAIEKTIMNIYIDWLVHIGTGRALGGINGWLSQRRKAGK